MSYATLEQRREAREAVRRPGKFESESPMVPILWDIVLDGFADRHDGSIARVGRWLVWQTEVGFVYGRRMASVEEAEATIDAEYTDSDDSEIGWAD